MLVHIFKKWFTQKGTARFFYQITVGFILTIALFGYIFKELTGSLAVVMLIAAPIMAIYYTIICHMEINSSMKRPLDDLK